MTDTYTKKKKKSKEKGKQRTSHPTHSLYFFQVCQLFFLLLLLLLIFLFSSYLFLVSYDEDEVGVELGFFWLTKSE